jgi:hypothetical protein
MRKFATSLLAAAAISGLSAMSAFAMPMNAAKVGDSVKAETPVQDVRLYCYNRYTGQFLHWGPCGGYYHYGYWHHWHRHWW